MQGSESEIHQCAVRFECLLCGRLHRGSCAEDHCHGTLEVHQGQLVSRRWGQEGGGGKRGQGQEGSGPRGVRARLYRDENRISGGSSRVLPMSQRYAHILGKAVQ